MTVADITPLVQYTLTGITDYSFSYRVFDETDLVVVYIDLTDTVTTWVLNTDYTVTLSVDGTGYISVTDTGAEGEITITRDLPATQEVDWENNDPLDMVVQENSFDKLTMLIQEIISQMLTTPPGFPAGVELPLPSSEAVIGWSTDETTLENYPSYGSFQSLADAAAASAAAALVSETNAAASEAAAATSETNAAASETAAAASAATASSDADAAAISAAAALASENTASAAQIAAETAQAAAELSEANAAYWAQESANCAAAAYTSEVNAAASETAAAASEAAALASENKAYQWAEESYGVEVDPGEYSAYHWATVAQNAAITEWEEVSAAFRPVVSGTGTLGDATHLVESLYLGDSNAIILGDSQEASIQYDGSNVVHAGGSQFTGNMLIGVDGSGSSGIQFYDDTNDAWRSIRWYDTGSLFQLEDSTGTFYDIWHTGNDSNLVQGDVTLDANIILGNTYGYQAEESGGTARNIANIGGSNKINIGDSNNEIELYSNGTVNLNSATLMMAYPAASVTDAIDIRNTNTTAGAGSRVYFRNNVGTANNESAIIVDSLAVGDTRMMFQTEVGGSGLVTRLEINEDGHVEVNGAIYVPNNNIVLGNTRSIQGTETGAAVRAILEVDSSDICNVGNANLPLNLRSDGTVTVPSANIVLGNTRSIQGTETGAAVRAILEVDSSDICNVGNVNLPTNIRSDGTLTHNGTDMITDLLPTQTTSGTVLQTNGSGTLSWVNVTGSLTSWEENGTTLRPTTTDYNIGDTTYRVGNIYMGQENSLTMGDGQTSYIFDSIIAGGLCLGTTSNWANAPIYLRIGGSTEYRIGNDYFYPYQQFDLGSANYPWGDFYAMGVYTTTASARNVYVNATGQLGYLTSAKKMKENIKKIGNTEWLYRLDPVTFNYRSDPNKTVEYGLIAEDVEKVHPDLCFYDEDEKTGKKAIAGINYRCFHALMLNELKKLRTELNTLKGA